jgi:hypothetical protein
VRVFVVVLLFFKRETWGNSIENSQCESHIW